ncbi:MAG: redoxin family protein [Bacteriovoracaceae bacterium]|nr:redoxin family protein [Bacteriovoracaceae bacterium]
MKIHFFQKLLLIASLMGLTFLYAYYERNKFYGSQSDQMTAPVLKELPVFVVQGMSYPGEINSQEFVKKSSGSFVHIWGTWCAPCEKEMPEFLSYAAKVEHLGLKFLLVAVNDEEVKIKKFLTRFPNIPKNVTFALDAQNKVMDLLGTLKVPETFLFNSDGKHINKFIGPQDWLSESYVTRLSFWLNDQKIEDRKIETH